MTALTRVDDLRKRYHENPRRFFAPLANEYRKTGFIDRALLLCEKHLFEQPGNMNGLIVYGQCLFETGRLEEAKQPFEGALEVDPENLIALRHLGDIARLGGDTAAARSWYERLLEVDRRNDEVIALLAEVGGGEASAPAAPSQAPNIVSVAGSVSFANQAESLGTIDLDPPAPPVVVPPTPRSSGTVTPRVSRTVTPASSAKTVEVTAEPKPSKRMSLLDVNFDFGESPVESAPPPAAPEALFPAEAAEYGFAAPEPEASAEEALDSLLAEVPSASEPELEPDVALESIAELAPALDTTVPMARFDVESIIEAPAEGESLSTLTPIDGLEAAEFSAEVSPLAGLEATEFAGGEVEPLADLDAMDFEPPSRPGLPVDGLEAAEFSPPQRPSLEDLPLLEPIGDPTPEDTPTVDGLPLLPALEDAETVVIDPAAMRARMEAPTFVTETMAELYVQQGHVDKAIEVYRQLIASAPFDQGLKDRLSALEENAAPRPSLGFDTPLASEVVEEAPPANAMLSAMSFDDVLLTTPVAPRESVPAPMVAVEAVTPVVATGPSAREFFAAFARRAATPLSTHAVADVGTGPTAGGALMSPLDALFGPSVTAEDEAAAHRLAAVGATSGPSGGSALDSLFGEGPAAPVPNELRAAVPRASEKLRFDQFFAAASAAAPEVVPESEPEPEPEPVVEMAEEPVEEQPEDQGGDDDDLDQFQGWLRGLTQ